MNDTLSSLLQGGAYALMAVGSWEGTKFILSNKTKPTPNKSAEARSLTVASSRMEARVRSRFRITAQTFANGLVRYEITEKFVIGDTWYEYVWDDAGAAKAYVDDRVKKIMDSVIVKAEEVR